MTAHRDHPLRQLPMFTRRAYLAARTSLDEGVPWMLAVEAVASVAIEHPEWDMDETRTWVEWEEEFGR